MATLVETTVDGGATGDYLTLFAAEADNFGATAADITEAGSDEYLECSAICTNGAADTTAVTVAGQTTDASHTITITVPEAYRHDGSGAVPTGDVYRLSVSGQGAVTIGSASVSLVGMFEAWSAAANAQYGLLLNGAAATGSLVDGCIVKATVAAYTNCDAIRISSAGATTVFVRSCMAYGARHGIVTVASGASAAITAHVSATTLLGGDYGIRLTVASGGSNDCTVKNNIAFGNTTPYSGTFNGNSTKNGYSSGTGPSGGSNAINCGTDADAVFVDYDNNDFHLLADVDNPAYRVGTPIDGVTTDIDGDARHATLPCIGADEIALSPTILSIDPDYGDGVGGEAFTITGTNFMASPTVTFGGTAATSVVRVDSTTITGIVPAHAAGAVTVTVTNTDASSGDLEAGYLYDPGLPGGADDPSRKKDENDPVSIWALQGPFKHRQDDFALPIKAPDPMKPLLRKRS